MATLLLAHDEPAARALPSNIEAEAAFLGAVLIENRIVEELATPLLADHFHEPLHGRIYQRIAELLDRRVVVTPVTLKPYFEADSALAELGGAAYLMRLTQDGAGLVSAASLAAQIYDLALLRQLVTVGRQLVGGALDTSETISPMARIEAAEAALYQVAEGSGTGGEAVSFGAAAKGVIAAIERARESGRNISGRTTGFASIDTRIGGLQDSDLVILAGRPGMGKSALATNIAFAAAERWAADRDNGVAADKSVGAAVAYFSLEMSADQLATRILAEQSGISGEELRKGKITKDDFLTLSYASQKLHQLPLYIDDTPAMSIAALRTRARRLKRRHDIGLIVVDYLQLLQGTGRQGADNRVNEISEISRGLKTLAKELNVPVVALSQLSRAVESREDKRPMLSDLRESGSIEQDADMVWFIYREDYYVKSREPRQPGPNDPPAVAEAHQKWWDEMAGVDGLAELIIGKQRHGATGKVRLKFEAKITRFTDLAEDARAGDRYD